MIETYAFLVAFLVQILAMSVLYPAWLIRRARAHALSVPTEQFQQLYPGVDLSSSVERFASRYRAFNTGIALFGFLLLGWLVSYMQNADWNLGSVKSLVTLYFIVQALPVGFIALLAVWARKFRDHPLAQSKRKAVLQRRGLFDFVSPLAVVLAVVAYFLFAAFVGYLQLHPFNGFAGIKSMIGVTLIYSLVAIVVYTHLYGRKIPLQTDEARAHTIGLTVRIAIYTCILTVTFVSLIFALELLELKRWEPFALSVFLATTTLLSSMGLTAPPRKPVSAF